MPLDPTDRIGKISGPMLKDNLVRDGIDLAFENDLLYIDATSQGIGINTDTVTRDLVVNGLSKFPELILTTGYFSAGTVVFNTNGTISSLSGPVEIAPQGPSPYITHDRIITDDYEINGNTFTGISTDADIRLESNGTGTVDFYANTNIDGNLYATGDISLTGNLNIGGTITVGNSPLDTVTIVPELDQNINPQTTGLYNLGLTGRRWRNARIASVNSTGSLTTGLVTVDGTLRIDSNTISTIAADTDVTVAPNGTGKVQFGNFRLSANDITNSGVNGTKVDLLDYAELANAVNQAVLGNPTYSFFNTVLIGLRPLGDVDGDGFVTVSDVNKIASFGLGTLSDGPEADWIQQQIRPYIIARKNLYPTLFDQVSAFTIVPTGQGYIQFGGTNGVVVPSGSNSQRTYPEVGDTRWNTELQRLECFDGNVYSLSTGGGELITPDDMEELGNVYALIFG
jgi:cytoskeletal protein CcmA (bactofilin family)